MYDEVDGLVYFKTPKTFVNGNAVIAALNESGEIIWSWNIWAVEGWDADATSRKAGATRSWTATSEPCSDFLQRTSLTM